MGTGLDVLSDRLLWVALLVAVARQARLRRQTQHVHARLTRPLPLTTSLHRSSSNSPPLVARIGSIMLVGASESQLERWAEPLGAALLVAVPMATLSPLLSVAGAPIGWVLGGMGRRQRERHRRSALRHALPDQIELLALAVEAGCNPLLALRHIARRCADPFAEAIAVVLADYDVGRRLADALEALPSLLGNTREPFDEVRPLVQIVASADRYGTALLEPLRRLAADARAARRQRADEAARRLPVKLLLPLISCVLPAFGVMTIAPLLASGLRSLRL